MALQYTVDLRLGEILKGQAKNKEKNMGRCNNKQLKKVFQVLSGMISLSLKFISFTIRIRLDLSHLVLSGWAIQAA